MDKQRKAFEAWWKSRPGTWRGTDHDLLYEVWKAATAAERERAAKVCDDLWDLRAGPQALMHAAKCADAIRAG